MVTGQAMREHPCNGQITLFWVPEPTASKAATAVPDGGSACGSGQALFAGRAGTGCLFWLPCGTGGGIMASRRGGFGRPAAARFRAQGPGCRCPSQDLAGMVMSLFGCKAVLETGPDAVWRVWTDVAVHTVVSFDAEAVVTGYGAEGSACTCSGRVGAGRRIRWRPR